MFRSDRRRSAALLAAALAMPAAAHDPVFSPGPHTLFKGGFEVHLGSGREQTAGEAEKETELSLLYGITGDWVAGIEIPYASADTGDAFEDLSVRTKYRFWRDDRLRVQESAAVLARVWLDTAEESDGATDALLGITYGYESLMWYRWASLRYRYNGETDTGVDRGDVVLADVVAGIRPRKLEYREPDAVWMLELNLEHQDRARVAGSSIPGTGGTRAFLSPGLMWTWRNVAVKPGVQIPVWSDLNGARQDPDFRALIELELHL